MDCHLYATVLQKYCHCCLLLPNLLGIVLSSNSSRDHQPFTFSTKLPSHYSLDGYHRLVYPTNMSQDRQWHPPWHRVCMSLGTRWHPPSHRVCTSPGKQWRLPWHRVCTSPDRQWHSRPRPVCTSLGRQWRSRQRLACTSQDKL